MNVVMRVGGGSDRDVSRHLAHPLGQPWDLGWVLHQKFCGYKPQKIAAADSPSNTAAPQSHGALGSTEESDLVSKANVFIEANS